MISVVTINYNNGEGLLRTVGSVLSQSDVDYEYIVIDGGSNDMSIKVIEEYKNRFSFVVSEPDSGIYNAMNKGIKAAKGSYILFLNSGDHFLNQKSLSSLSSHAGSADFIYGDLVIGGHDGYIKKYPSKLSLIDFVVDGLPHPSTLINRSLFETRSLYDEEYQIVSDWKFFVEGICKHQDTYLHVDQPISVFYLDGVSSSESQKELIDQERARVLRESFFLDDSDREFIIKQLQLRKRLRSSAIVKFINSFGFFEWLHQ